MKRKQEHGWTAPGTMPDAEKMSISTHTLPVSTGRVCVDNNSLELLEKLFPIRVEICPKPD